MRHALPRLVQPEGNVPGRSELYASVCGGCPAGCGVLVRAADGRPIKLEGNPEHPLSRGGLCAAGQASLLGLYDQQRPKDSQREGKEVSWDRSTKRSGPNFRPSARRARPCISSRDPWSTHHFDASSSAPGIVPRRPACGPRHSSRIGHHRRSCSASNAGAAPLSFRQGRRHRLAGRGFPRHLDRAGGVHGGLPGRPAPARQCRRGCPTMFNSSRVCR